MEKDLAWIILNGVIRRVERFIESDEFALGIRRLKATCVATGMEGGEQVVREQLVTRNFNLVEPSATSQLTQAMHASMKAFLDKDFASYLCLGELDKAGFHQLSNAILIPKPSFDWPIRGCWALFCSSR